MFLSGGEAWLKDQITAWGFLLKPLTLPLTSHCPLLEACGWPAVHPKVTEVQLAASPPFLAPPNAINLGPQ